MDQHLLHLGAVGRIGLPGEHQLRAADHPVAEEGGKDHAAPEVHFVEHTGEPVACLVVCERREEADRRASLDGVDQKVGQVVEVAPRGNQVEAADDHLGPAPDGGLGHRGHGRRVHAGSVGASSSRCKVLHRSPTGRWSSASAAPRS